MSDPDMIQLDALLDDVAGQSPAVSDDLMSAVLRDAALEQPRPTTPRLGLWDALLDAIGGWPAVGGMAAAGVAGLWLGVAPPVALETATVQLLGATETVDLFGANLLDGFAVEDQLQ